MWQLKLPQYTTCLTFLETFWQEKCSSSAQRQDCEIVRVCDHESPRMWESAMHSICNKLVKRMTDFWESKSIRECGGVSISIAFH